MRYDFVAIGDTVTDAFIRLDRASVRCSVDHDHCELCMPFGDKIPYTEAFVIPAVGNSANAAVCAARLGLRSALVTNLGADYYGKESLRVLEEEYVGTEFIGVHQGIPTNYHYVLWYEDDRTILIRHEKYPVSLPDLKEPSWVYLSSLGEHAYALHDELADYLDAHPAVRLAFQPGTFQIKIGRDRLSRIYKRSELFFCNKEEAERILEHDGDMKELLAGIHALGPRVVVITDGTKGAYASDGTETWMIHEYPDPKPPLERTGAGDAFSATFTVAIAQGKSIREALMWGPINSMSVVQQVGARAGLLRPQDFTDYLVKAPKDYPPVRL